MCYKGACPLFSFNTTCSLHLWQLALPHGVIEVGLRALLHDLAALHEHDLVGVNHGAEAVLML